MTKLEELKSVIDNFYTCFGLDHDYMLSKARKFLKEYNEVLSEKSSQEFVKEDV